MKVMLLWGKMLMTSARICVNEHSNSKLDPHYNMVAKISLKSLQRLGLSAISITNVSTYKITDHSFYSVHWFIESIFLKVFFSQNALDRPFHRLDSPRTTQIISIWLQEVRDYLTLRYNELLAIPKQPRSLIMRRLLPGDSSFTLFFWFIEDRERTSKPVFRSAFV